MKLPTTCELSRILTTVLAGLILLGASTAAPAQQEPEAAGNAALAERVGHIAQQALAGRAIVPETLRQTSALLDAAMRLNPDEVRYPRLAVEAALQLRDTEAAIAAYRAIRRIDPADQVAQLRLMDMYVGQMETADKRLDYLSRLVESTTVPAEVRSHAAYLAALIQLERGRIDDAIKLLDDALGLFPLSPEALKKKWELAARNMTPRQRVEILLAMLRSNPAQPGVMADVAAAVGDMGLAELSLQWYGMAVDLGQAVGRGIDAEDVTRYLAQLVITDLANVAEPILERLVQADPGNVDAGFVGMLIQRRSGNPDKLAKAREDARNALSVLAMYLHDQVVGNTEPSATQPAEPIDIAADVNKLAELKNPQLTAAYASLLADLAWVQCYFNQQPQEAEQFIALLRQLVPAESPVLARLEGWQFLAANRPQEAAQKLSAVADSDPMAQLGMVLLMAADPATKEQATAAARELFLKYPSGLMGAIIVDALRDKIDLGPGKGLPTPEGSEEVRKLVEAFPLQWLDFIGKPGSIYELRADPLKVSHGFGEPILAQVTIRNISPFDITIGQDGALRTDLWFDLQLRGLVQQGFQGITFDRIGQRVQLQPGQSIKQTVRVDQGQLAGLLASNPTVAIPLYFSVFTNPITLQTGISPGPGGQRVQFSRVVSRNAAPVMNEQAMAGLINALAAGQGTPQQRMEAADLLASYSRALVQQQDERLKNKGLEMIAALKRAATRDPSAAVRAWTSFLLPRVEESPEQRVTLVQNLLASADWTQRILGLVLVQSLDHDKWKALATPLADSDPDETVKRLAEATVAYADSPASLEPTTQPQGASPEAASTEQ